MFSFLKSNSDSEGGERSNKLRLILIVGGALLGVFLLLFGSGVFHTETEEMTEETASASSEDELLRYQSYLEERVKALCETVKGVGNVTAIVSLESGFEAIYATEENDGNEQYVVLGSGASAQALFLTHTAPTVSGIGIVCTGGDNASVRQELTSLLSATFHISSNRIYITGAQ